jgi:hypothetical protein
MVVAGGSGVPDLRHATAETHAIFADIVRGGALQTTGMPRFDDLLTPEQVHLIQAFILHRARTDAPEDPGGGRS